MLAVLAATGVQHRIPALGGRLDQFGEPARLGGLGGHATQRRHNRGIGGLGGVKPG